VKHGMKAPARLLSHMRTQLSEQNKETEENRVVAGRHAVGIAPHVNHAYTNQQTEHGFVRAPLPSAMRQRERCCRYNYATQRRPLGDAGGRASMNVARMYRGSEGQCERTSIQPRCNSW